MNPRVVETVEQLEALPDGTTFRCACGYLGMVAGKGRWVVLETGRKFEASEFMDEHAPLIPTAAPAVSAEQVEAAARAMNTYYSRGGVISSADAFRAGLDAAGIEVTE